MYCLFKVQSHQHILSCVVVRCHPPLLMFCSDAILLFWRSLPMPYSSDYPLFLLRHSSYVVYINAHVGGVTWTTLLDFTSVVRDGSWPWTRSKSYSLDEDQYLLEVKGTTSVRSAWNPASVLIQLRHLWFRPSICRRPAIRRGCTTFVQKSV